jgi:serine/threonine protein kinase
MPSSADVRIPQLPIALHRHIARLEHYLGTGGMSHVFRASLINLPALIGELMIAGETDPRLFQLDIPFTFGKGPIADERTLQAIRDRADTLWEEYRSQQSQDPDLARKTRERYLGVIDRRLLKNPEIAIKVLRRDAADGTIRQAYEDQFERENQALRKLDHRNVIRRFASIEEPKLGPCLLLEHIQGRTLEQALDRRRDRGEGLFPLPTVAHIAYQLAQALTHCHAHGVIHCDIKPANIFSEKPTVEELRSGRIKGLVKLTDFGISRAMGDPAPEAGRLSGTLQYIAPEQFRKLPPTPATDVYQLGTTLFVLSTGRLPYETAPLEEYRERLLRPGAHPARVHHFRSEVSPRFEAIIEGTREKDPEKRWTLVRVLEEVAQLYTSREFTVKDSRKSHLLEELLDRVQTNCALQNYFRAGEALELAAGFLGALPEAKAAEAKRRYDTLMRTYEPHRAAVDLVRRVQKEHIAPVDMMMDVLYKRYEQGRPLLKDQEKGIINENGDDVQIVRRSLIDRILQHTSAAIKALSTVDPELVGEMHRKMVDRASSQEEACSDLVKREVKFGEDYLKGAAPTDP